MAFNTGDVVRVTKDCDGYGYPDFVGEIGYIIGISSHHADGGTPEDPVIYVEFNVRILLEESGKMDPKMQFFGEELEYVGHIENELPFVQEYLDGFLTTNPLHYDVDEPITAKLRVPVS